MSGVVVKVTENKLIVTKEDKKVRITAPYVDNHYDATFASDAETLAGTEATKAVSPASLASVKDVEGGFASKAYADAKVAESITEDVTGVAPSQAVVFDALALKAPLASPTFTGDVVVPDQTAGNNSTKAANTKYVDAKVADAIVNGVTGIAPSQNVVYDELLIKEQVDNLTYAGVDLTTKFATEIAGYADVWAWIKARITAVNYAGLNIGDYITVRINARLLELRIAGIDTYYGVGSPTKIGHHVDFIAEGQTFLGVWQNIVNNNGTADNPCPWMASNAKAYLNSTYWDLLPAPLQAQIIDKHAYLEQRYSGTGTLTASNGASWQNMGKLWLPSEFEIFGAIIRGTKPFSALCHKQYPLFAHRTAKNYGIWTSTVSDGNSGKAVMLGTSGAIEENWVTNEQYGMPCFRIG